MKLTSETFLFYFGRIVFWLTYIPIRLLVVSDARIHHLENAVKHNKKTKDFDDHLDKITEEQIKDMNQVD
jgi:hypothetical protein